MKRSLALVALAVLVLAVCWFVFGRGDASPSVAAVAPPAVAEPRARESTPLDTPRAELESARTAANAPVAETPASGAKAAAVAPKTFRIRGRVCDVVGASIGSVAVAADHGSTLVQSTADGTFELEFEAGRDVLLVARPKTHVTVRAARANESAAASELCIVVAPQVALAGRVVDSTGAPVEGALVSREVPDLLFAGLPFPLDHSSSDFDAERVVKSNGLGRFAFIALPRLSGVFLEVEAKGFRPKTQRLDDASFDHEVVIELERPDPATPGLDGIVVHRDGAPAEGATVRIDALGAKTDEHGAFHLPLEYAVRVGAPLIAVLKGYQPAVVPDIDALIAKKDEDRPPLRVVLGPAALAISGRVLDAALRPAAKWQVQLLDGTRLSFNQIPSELAESIAGGNRVKATTDPAGRFELRGLVDRDYRVLVSDPKSLIRFESDPIAAGTHGVDLVAPADALWPKLAGRVVGLDSAPIAGVQVAISVVLEIEGYARSFMSSKEVTTDAEGRFTFEGVAWREAMFSLSGDVILPQTVPLDVDVDREHVELRVGRRVHFRIETSRPPETVASSAELLRSDGEPESIYRLEASGWWNSFEVPLTAGRSQVHSVVEGAYTLVLKSEGDVEIERRAVTLAPGDVQVISY
ncbi:MAG: carboxypeptidase-like regulatory domain-containing protein [Planctomycetes bacterium]|nr:carboxypeptidase-like regulatory domain-containing protein [Planctomycetota bacterium]